MGGHEFVYPAALHLLVAPSSLSKPYDGRDKDRTCKTKKGEVKEGT